MTIFSGLLNHSFTVYRKIRASDGQGGWSEAWAEISAVPGRLRPVNPTEQTVATQEQARIGHTLYTPAGVDIARGDLVIGGGKTVEVLDIREPSLAGHHLEIDCREIQKEPEEEGS